MSQNENGLMQLNHIAFIMDGNGRWGTAQDKNRLYGHEMGAVALLRAIDCVEEVDIPYATFYAFSSDNNKRPKQEIAEIMGVITYYLHNSVLPLALERNYKIRFIGEMKLLPEELLDVVNDIKTKTCKNKKRVICFALCYGGDVELVHAANLILKDRFLTKDTSPITLDEIYNHLYTVNLPSPDIVVRYGGYKRLSNFMPLQTIYSEIFFLDSLWPDFVKEDIIDIVEKWKKTKKNLGNIQ